MTFLPLVLCPVSVSVPREPMLMLCRCPEQVRTLPWGGGCWHPGAPAALLSPWCCYKYRLGAISIPTPAGLEARPPRCLKLFLAHLDSFHPACSAASPEQVHRVHAAPVAQGSGVFHAPVCPCKASLLVGPAWRRGVPSPWGMCSLPGAAGLWVPSVALLWHGRGPLQGNDAWEGCESHRACAGGAAEAAQQLVVWLGLGTRSCWEEGLSTGGVWRANGVQSESALITLP